MDQSLSKTRNRSLSARLNSLVLISLFVCMLPPLTLAQDARPPQRSQAAQETPLSASIRAHWKSANSKSDINAIPAYQVYRNIFLRTLFDPSLAVRFPDSDWELIQDLPSHRDTRFISFAIESVSNACEKIISEFGNRRSAQAIASHYRNSKREIDKNLNDHYEQVLASLSNAGRSIVLEEAAKLADTESIVHSELDILGLSATEPEFVSEFLKDSCANLKNVSAILPLNQRYLRDEFTNAYEDGVLMMHQ